MTNTEQQKTGSLDTLSRLEKENEGLKVENKRLASEVDHLKARVNRMAVYFAHQLDLMRAFAEAQEIAQ